MLIVARVDPGGSVAETALLRGSYFITGTRMRRILEPARRAGKEAP